MGPHQMPRSTMSTGRPQGCGRESTGFGCGTSNAVHKPASRNAAISDRRGRTRPRDDATSPASDGRRCPRTSSPGPGERRMRHPARSLSTADSRRHDRQKLLICPGKREAGLKKCGHRRAVSTVGPEPAAVAIEPGARSIVIRRQALHQSPEARPVIHLREMRDLVRHNIIENAFRRQDEPPAERKTPGRRAAAPAARRIAHGNPGDRPADPRRQQARPACHLLARHADQIVAASTAAAAASILSGIVLPWPPLAAIFELSGGSLPNRDRGGKLL